MCLSGKEFKGEAFMRTATVSGLVPCSQDIFFRGMSVLSLLAFVSCLTVTGWCQDQATILGLVTDSSGAVVSGVKVTVANSERGVTRETTSNSNGEYDVPKVPIGS